MPSLLDRPSDEALQLLRAIALGYDEAGGVWPCWQWVKHKLWGWDLDAEEVLQGLPTWQYNYRSIRAGAHGQIPDNGELVALSVHGLVNTVLPSMRWLVKGFLTAINLGLIMQRGIQPSPTEAVELRVSGEEFTRTINGQAGTDLRVDQLFGVLKGEPATWRGINQNAGQESWDLTDVRLSRYAGIRDARTIWPGWKRW